MAILRLQIDSKNLPGAELLPEDLELSALVVRNFALICYREPGLSLDDLKIRQISFRNPLKIEVFLKYVSVDLARSVLRRILFYEQELTRRSLENEKLHQDVLQLKLRNLDEARALRKRLIEDGLSSEDANRMLASITSSEKITMSVRRPSGVSE